MKTYLEEFIEKNKEWVCPPIAEIYKYYCPDSIRNSNECPNSDGGPIKMTCDECWDQIVEEEKK